MALIQTTPLNIPQKSQASSGNNQGVPSGIVGELTISEVLGRYSHLVKAGKVFTAYALVTAPVIFSTAAGTGGPLIWNRPNSGVDAHILAASFGGLTTAATAAGAVGLTGNGGQSVAPTTTTTIDGLQNNLVGGGATQMGGVFRIGTVANAGVGIFPLIAVGTGAITAVEIATSWVDVGGAFIIPPGSWGSLAGNATLTAGVMALGLMWAELPS
jgi:hypothetical protein